MTQSSAAVTYPWVYVGYDVSLQRGFFIAAWKLRYRLIRQPIIDAVFIVCMQSLSERMKKTRL